MKQQEPVDELIEAFIEMQCEDARLYKKDMENRPQDWRYAIAECKQMELLRQLEPISQKLRALGSLDMAYTKLKAELKARQLD